MPVTRETADLPPAPSFVEADQLGPQSTGRQAGSVATVNGNGALPLKATIFHEKDEASSHKRPAGSSQLQRRQHFPSTPVATTPLVSAQMSRNISLHSFQYWFSSSDDVTNVVCFTVHRLVSLDTRLRDCRLKPKLLHQQHFRRPLSASVSSIRLQCLVADRQSTSTKAIFQGR